MKKTTDPDLADKIIECLRKGLRKLAEEAAAKDEELIIGDKDGNVRSVPAKELLKNLPPAPPSQ